MSVLEVEVGGLTTTVSFSGSTRWPDEAWLDRARSLGRRAVFVFDGAVRALPGTRLGELGEVAESVPGRGEEAKRWPAVEAIVDAAMAHGLGRDGCVVGVGGGAVCDVSAFAASVYMRGVAVELVPTTLLAMVDAAVGGKTAINFRGYKNLVGTFHPARRIDVPLGALASLPERELRNGLAEVIKAGLLGEEDLYALLERRRDAVLGRDPEVMEEVVRRSVVLKAGVVSQDPTENGRRAILNLGHTFGHALEAVSGPGTVSHGAAVAWGIARALDLGTRLGRTDRGHRDETRALLRSYGFALKLDELAPSISGAGAADLLLAAMRQDKKKLDGELRFVLQRRRGDTFVAADVAEGDVRAVLDQEL